MNPFDFSVHTATDDALAAIGRAPAFAGPPRFIAGGTNLLDLMKERVVPAGALIDIHRLPLADITLQDDGSLHLGALATNADTAQHTLVQQHFPLLRSAILAGASPQLRNLATNGGNLLQRTRCYYFYDAAVPCNKRRPGSGCPAVTGLARQHAVLGANANCVATHPSDMCVALAALEATVHVRSASGQRSISFEEFHRLPGDRPDLDTTLAPDELITHLTLPEASRFAKHSTYLKVRERASYAFALVSVAAALDLDDSGLIRDARLAIGSVAHKPWRVRAAEALLVGQAPTAEAFEKAADAALEGARPWGGPGAPDTTTGNSFKIELARRAVRRAFEMARDGISTNTGEDAARAQGADSDATAASDSRGTTA